jgi:hypothetical protein
LPAIESVQAAEPPTKPVAMESKAVEHELPTSSHPASPHAAGQRARVVWMNGSTVGRVGIFTRFLLALLFVTVLLLAATFAFFLAAIAVVVFLFFLFRFWVLRWWQGKPTGKGSDGTADWKSTPVFRTQGYLLINGVPAQRRSADESGGSTLPPNVIEIPPSRSADHSQP